MSTVVPPPSKRQRTDASNRAREQQDIEEIPADAGSLRLQFFDETTALPIGEGPVLVPVADANPKNLELLLNTLQGHVQPPLIFQYQWLILRAGFIRAHSLPLHPPSLR
jgi:ribosome assembly protein 4